MQAPDAESSSATPSSQFPRIAPNDRLLTQREALVHLSRRMLARLVGKGKIKAVPSRGDTGRILYVESTVLEQAEALRTFLNKSYLAALAA